MQEPVTVFDTCRFDDVGLADRDRLTKQGRVCYTKRATFTTAGSFTITNGFTILSTSYILHFVSLLLQQFNFRKSSTHQSRLVHKAHLQVNQFQQQSSKILGFWPKSYNCAYPPSHLEDLLMPTRLEKYRLSDKTYRKMLAADEIKIPRALKVLKDEKDAKGIYFYRRLASDFGEATWEILDWLVEEAKLGHRVVKVEVLNIPCFFYMQHYPWFMRKLAKGVRLFVGHLECYLTRCELWVGWHPSQDADAPPELRFYGECDDSITGQALKITPNLRKYIQWHDSFKQVFRIEDMGNGVVKDTVIRQDAHLRAIAKVLARFPGLVCERDPEDDRFFIKANGSTWEKFPFTKRESPKPENPYQDFTALLDVGNVAITDYEEATNRGASTEAEENFVSDNTDDEEKRDDDDDEESSDDDAESSEEE
ncbi:hypothetical protein KCU93_g2678, partial [Aureobasidium melanogenum]